MFDLKYLKEKITRVLTRKETMQKLPYNFGKLKNTSPNDIYLPKRSQLNTKQQLPFGKQTCCRPTVLNLQISVSHGRLLKFKALKNTKASGSVKKKMLTTVYLFL